MISLCCLVFLVGQCWCFEVTRGDDASVEEGDSFVLSCTSDSYYEFCLFRSPAGGLCDYEWRREVWNITQLSCPGLEDRLTFIGSYSDYECSVLVKDAQIGDAGLWTCELESYVLGGGRGSGWVLSEDIMVDVILSTTTTTTTTATTTTTEEYQRSRSKVDVEWKTPSYNHSLPFLPSTKLDLNLSLARTVPVAVSVFVILVFISLFAVLVIAHKKKNIVQAGLREETCDQSTKEDVEEKDSIRIEEMRFMRSVFPHIIQFPNKEPGLNL